MLVVLCGLAAIAQFRAFGGHDISWLLYMGRRLVHGERLYVDLIEVNPPLIIWLSAGPAWLAEVLGARDVDVLRVVVFLLCTTSTALTIKVLRVSYRLAAVGVLALAVTLVFVEFLLPEADFAQREHLMLVLVLPYLATLAGRLAGWSPTIPMAGLCGVLAGVGFALKPHFLLAFLLGEACVLYVKGRSAVVRVEALAIWLVLAVYAGAVVVLVPEYVGLVRRVSDLYIEFLRIAPWMVLFGAGALAALAALVVAIGLRRSRTLREWRGVLGVVTVCFLLSAVLQQKGLPYHLYPAMGIGILLLGASLYAARGRLLHWIDRLFVAVGIAVLVAVGGGVVWRTLHRAVEPMGVFARHDAALPQLLEVVRELPGRPTLMALSNTHGVAFPLVNESGARWGGTLPSLWFVVAAYRREFTLPPPFRYRSRAEMAASERYLYDLVVTDFVASRPDLLIVRGHGPDRVSYGLHRQDYLRYFLADPRFRGEFEHYGYYKDVGIYRIYRRISSDWQPLAPAPTAGPVVPTDETPFLPGVTLATLDAQWVLRVGAFLAVLAAAYFWAGGSWWSTPVPGARRGRAR